MHTILGERLVIFSKKIHIENTVRRLRFNNNEMTQLELADLVSISRQTVVAIEKYKYTPSLELAFKIALAFNKEIQDVFFISP
jgi:putative transcriptional regulator